ncbi:alkaline phosphatase family protein [Gaopeijia maritima]|uniref:alkaline phosphatase family protein n=1 Tax=Gaopeijia maritima TaxID=3119007 RepID=UPI00324DDA92
MLRSLRLTALSLAVVASGCGPGGAPAADPAPTLIVALPVDQLRSDLLERYDTLFTGGLRRLLDEGLVHPNSTHDHANNFTAVGHTTLATGVHPTRHEVVGNEWHIATPEGEWRSVYAVEDPDSPILGHPDYPGRSPVNIARPGLADWVLAQDPEARVAAISGKDRGSIPMMAQARGEVYWLLAEQGEIVTTTWYHDALPEWVAAFNEERMPELYGDTLWESIVPPGAEALTLPDSAPWEGFRGGRFATFPHLASAEATGLDDRRLQYNRWRQNTPFQSKAIFAFAEELIERFELGQRGPVDYLVVGMSQVDYVGHMYGPLSVEQLDNLLRLDRELGAFLDFLDATVGEGRWVMGVSADHGVADVPEALDRPDAARLRLTSEDRARLDAVADAAAEAAHDLEPRERAERVAAALEATPEIVRAISLHRLQEGPTGDSLLDLYRNSMSTERRTSRYRDYDVVVYYEEGMLANRGYGTTHGTPWLYDRAVPLIFLGAGVEPGRSDERVATVDFAPTLAALAGIEVPDDLDGRAVIGRPPR